MNENTGSDKCYECPKGRREASALAYRSAYDGKIEKSDEFKNNVENKVSCNTENEEGVETRAINNELSTTRLGMRGKPAHPSRSKMPSPLSPKQSKTQRRQEVIDNQLAVTAGDKVTVEDCPAHWLWASPFTVEAIDDEMVKLEMVGELVKINRLSRSGINHQN